MDGIIQLVSLILYEFIVAFFLNAFRPMEKSKSLYLFLSLTPLALMIMFHNPIVGNDSMTYYNLVKSLRGQRLGQVLQNNRYEHGYLLFNWALGQFTDNPQWVFILIGFFIILSVGFFLKKYIDAPGLVCILLVETLMVDSWISVARQTIVVGILFWAFGFIIKKKPLGFAIMVLLASTFHYVAIVLLIAYPLINFTGGGTTYRGKKLSLVEINLLLISIVVSVSLGGILQRLLTLFPTYSYYRNGARMNGDARLAVILQIIVAILMIYVPRDRKSVV